ncbi:MAG: hypothetical protein NZ990_08180 [Myxococcota bacterium]|nr:hypothetical protein [Myxococcota bacterium]
MSDGEPVWSNDGERIAYSGVFGADNIDIFVMDADGSNRVNLTAEILRTYSQAPCWSPSGDRIAFSSTRGFSGFGVLPQEIWAVNLADGEWTQLTEGPYEGDDYLNTFPSWSPLDGDGRIALSSCACRGNNCQRCKFSSNTAEYQIYTIHEGNDPTTKPSLLFPSPGKNFQPAWSPDGAKIAFTSTRADEASDNFDIWVIDVPPSGEASNPVRLTDHEGIDDSPAWSGDGQHILFSSNRQGHYEIYRIGVDGEGLERITYSQNGTDSKDPDGRMAP